MLKRKIIWMVAIGICLLCLHLPSPAAAVCGNGVVEGNERCDGTKFKNNATCKAFTYKNALGKLEKFTGGTLKCTKKCNLDLSGCKKNSCGDGIIGGTEKCEWTGLGGATCQSLGFDGGALKCNGYTCQYNTAGCIAKACGNGKVDTTEQCEGKDLQGATCPKLGYGDSSGALACTAQCSFDVSQCKGTPQDPYGATPPLQLPICGNWKLDGGESCDIAKSAKQTCKDLGFFGGTITCGPTCSLGDLNTSTCYGWGQDLYGVPQVPSYQAKCGNGYLDAGELCDYGWIAGLGAAPNQYGKTCQELGYFNTAFTKCNYQCNGFLTIGTSCYGWGTDPYGTPMSAEYMPKCGNGYLDPGETCDGGAIAGAYMSYHPSAFGVDCSSLGYFGGGFGGKTKCDTSCSGYTENTCSGWGPDPYGTKP